jgi:hypothetical protein
MTKKVLATAVAIILAGTAYRAVAQATNATADPYGNAMPSSDDDDDDDDGDSGKWGLLGLLGHAGLARLKRRDRDDHRVHTNTNTTDRR